MKSASALCEKLRQFGAAIGLTIAAGLLASCVTQSKYTHAQYVDEMTGVTVSTMLVPITFYRENQAIAVNTRDFASLGAVQINRTGDRNYYLWLGLWSTIDRSFTSEAGYRPGNGILQVFVDDRKLVFERYTEHVRKIGTAKPVYAISDPNTRTAFYRVTIDELRLMAESDYLSVAAGDASESLRTYSQWDAGNQSLVDFVAQVIDGNPWSEDFRAAVKR